VEEHVIGVDIGTSRCRAVLYDLSGRGLGEASRPYPILNPRPGWYEHDPDQVLRAFVESLAEILRETSGKRLLGIGLGTYFHSILAVDRDGRPLGNCIIWPDMRARDTVDRLKDEADPRRIYQRTGCPLHPLYPLARVVWMRERSSLSFSRLHRVVSMKEYVVERLFGEYVVDWSTASGSGLLNVQSLRWDEEALELAGLKEEQLSPLASPLTSLPPVREEWARHLPIPRGVPVILGGPDGVLSNIGAGAVAPGEADNTLGTGGAVRVLVPHPILDEAMRTWCYAGLPGYWVVGGVTASGLVYEWFVREFAHEEKEEARRRGVSLYRVLDERAQEIPPGSEGLIFLPFIAGGRTPRWDPNACGVLFGLRREHTRGHLLRALMEGVTLERYLAFRAVEEVVGGIRSLRVSGGLAESSVWLRMTADVYGREILVPEVPQNSAWGAAVTVLLAQGILGDLMEVRDRIPIREKVTPDPRVRRVYDECLRRFEDLYGRLFG